MPSSTESMLQRLRLRAGAVLYDLPRFERQIRGRRWLEVRNRNERITTDGRGVQCEWRYTSDLHIAKAIPSTGVRLMQHAFAAWPVTALEEPVVSGTPRVSFLIGHRGVERLPHLLATLRTIAGQNVPAECIVVEQSPSPRIDVPPWVRYIHTPVPASRPYSRADAFNVAARHAQTPVLICHDNDLLVPESYAREALARIAEGWQFLNLKRYLFYLSEAETRAIFSGANLRTDLHTTIVQNAQGGSIVALADAFRTIGGFDEEFIGWGGEDNDFWDRAETSEKVYAFGYLPMIHLHHEFQQGKWSETGEGVKRYRAMESLPPRDRIDLLLRRRTENGC